MPDNKAHQQNDASLPAQGPNAGFSISVHRNGSKVTVSLTAADDYAGIELYDHIVNSLKAGMLQLTVGRA